MTAGRRASNARGWGFTAEIDIADLILIWFISQFEYTVCHGKCMSSNLLRLMSSSGVFLYSIDLWPMLECHPHCLMSYWNCADTMRRALFRGSNQVLMSLESTCSSILQTCIWLRLEFVCLSADRLTGLHLVCFCPTFVFNISLPERSNRWVRMFTTFILPSCKWHPIAKIWCNYFNQEIEFVRLWKCLSCSYSVALCWSW